MDWETAGNIADTYDQVMQLLKQFSKPEANVKASKNVPGACYVETVDGEFHRVSEWNNFADRMTGNNAFYHVR